MFREDLIDTLMARPISRHELALLLDSRPRDLEDDLRHLLSSLRKDEIRPSIVPARCGFLFDDHKLHKPGKRPRCNGRLGVYKVTERCQSIPKRYNHSLN